MKVLVVGSGYVGSELCQILSLEGHEVFGLRRTPSPSKEFHELTGDILDTDLALPAHIDWLVYCASPGARTETAYRRCYVDGVQAAVERTRPKKAVLTSSTGCMGENEGSWVDESSPANPTTETGKVLLEAEHSLHAHRHFMSTDAVSVVLRLSGIYGPGRTRLVNQVRSGEARSTNSLRWTNRIHRDDCAGAAAHLLQLKEVAPLYIGVDEEPVDLSDVFRFIAEETDVTLEHAIDLPSRPNKRCSSKLLRDTGYRFRFPTFREGYRSLIAAKEPDPTND